MKRFRLIVSDPAREDLHQIFDYILADNPPAAKKFLNRIETSLSRLAVFPLSGKVPRDESFQAKGYRVRVIDDYLAFYKVGKGTLTLLRVIHGRRDYAFLL